MQLVDFFMSRQAAAEPLVLVTVFATAGSTYSKAGGQMVIDSAGNFCGMLSGGCLEGDLVERARNVIETGGAEIATYDLGADDELWGLGVGCDGAMSVLLQPLSAASDYQPFATIVDILNGGEPATIATVVRSAGPAVNAGSAIVMRGKEVVGVGVTDAISATISAERPTDGKAALRQVSTSGGECEVLYTTITPSPSLLVLGAGLDSEAVVRFAQELGWRSTVVDHRSAYIENRSYPDATTTQSFAAADLLANIDPSRFDMALVMTHHLASDRAYLAQLATTEISYIGLLGPKGRRDRLLGELGDAADQLQDRLQGPAGLQLGGRGPGPIALEIVAEMQRHLGQRG